jgi:hypothetical protein
MIFKKKLNLLKKGQLDKTKQNDQTHTKEQKSFQKKFDHEQAKLRDQTKHQMFTLQEDLFKEKEAKKNALSAEYRERLEHAKA